MMLKYEFFFYFWPAHPKGLGISGIGRELKSKSVMHSTHSILSINASVIQGVRKSGRQPRPAVVRASTHIPQSAQNYNNSILIITLPTQPPHLFTNLIFVFKLQQLSISDIYFHMYISVSSVVEFQIWWVPKSKVLGQESTCHQGKIFKNFLRVMTVCQKLGVILESKVVEKLSLEKKVFDK